MTLPSPNKLSTEQIGERWQERWFMMRQGVLDTDKKYLPVVNDIESLLDQAWIEGRKSGLDWALTELRRWQASLPINPPDGRTAIEGGIEMIQKRMEIIGGE